MKLSSISACALSFIVAIPVLVHADSASGIPLADAVRERSITIALWASAISVGLILIAIFAKNASNEFKKLLFALLVTAIVGPTIYFIGSTINLNLSSIANGPVHWHADFEIIACGEELPPPNAPHKLSNKTGTPVLHQHVDKRYHVEGVVLDLEEVALDRFFEVQGGALTENTFRVPTGDTIKTYSNGDACPSGEQGSWNVFLYKVDEATHTATQTKLADYARYTPSAHELVPPGDCIIFEFGPERAYTDRLCNFHQIAVNKGELKIEVPAKEVAETGSQEVIDTNNWQTYRDNLFGYGYELKFPEDLVLQFERDGLFRIFDNKFVEKEGLAGNEYRNLFREIYGDVTKVDVGQENEIINKLRAREGSVETSTIQSVDVANGRLITYVENTVAGPRHVYYLLSGDYLLYLETFESHADIANGIIQSFRLPN